MRRRLILAVLGSVTMAGAAAMAQTPPGGQGGPGGPGGPGGGPPNFAAMRQMMMDRMKEAMGASDDEWKALEPLIEKVQQLQRDARGGGMFMFMGRGPGGPGGPGGRGGPGGPGFGPGGDQAPSPVMQASQDLRDTLENKDAKPADIQAKLKVLRDARAKAHDDLAKAQDDLKGLLTTRQEAVLVTMGMLE